MYLLHFHWRERSAVWLLADTRYNLNVVNYFTLEKLAHSVVCKFDHQSCIGAGEEE